MEIHHFILPPEYVCRFFLSFYMKKKLLLNRFLPLEQQNQLNTVRLLLVYGASPLTLSEIDRIWRSYSPQSAKLVIEREMALCAENPSQYRANCSALIPLAIGLAQLDLPVLIVAAIGAHFARLNEQQFVAEYSAQKSWEIAVLVKRKAFSNRA